jgi:hypothetical protein
MTPPHALDRRRPKRDALVSAALVLAMSVISAAFGAPTDGAATSAGGAWTEAAAVASSGAGAHILSAYHGLEALPATATIACGTRVTGMDGMPVTFSVQLDADSVTADAFAVETASGTVVTPRCATLRPATEPLERRTVLLAGNFSTADGPPRAVAVVGALEDVHGRRLTGMRTDAITPLAAGPSLILAERFDPATPGLVGECPADTLQVVQLVWEGGVTGPGGAALGEPQRWGVRVTLEGGEAVTPVALADDDPDNFVLACLDTAVPARSVAVDGGLFFDPGDDPNPATAIDVVPGGGR